MKFLLLMSFHFLAISTFGQNITKAQLDSIMQKAKATHSDGLLILQDGNILVEEYFNQPQTPTYIASVGKALIGIAIIKLLNDGKIKSIDQPIADFYAEWRQGQKKNITLRMIMSHTSGLQNDRNTRLEIETGPNGSGNDLVKLALAAEVSEKPGTIYRYNNKAICLLPGLIERASGKRMDQYFEEEFFKPMGISQFVWIRDSVGTPQGHAGFKLLPKDLAKFGQLMLEKGSYKGKRYFEERWVDSAIAASQSVNQEIGLIWHRSLSNSTLLYLDEEQLKKLGEQEVSNHFLMKLKPLVGKFYQGEQELGNALESLLGANWLSEIKEAVKVLPNGVRDLFLIKSGISRMKGFYHSGSWGNYLVIYPELKIVAVRLVKRDKDYIQDKDLFGGFISAVFNLGSN